MSVPAWLSTNLTGWRNSWNNTHPSCHILLSGLCELAACPKKPWQANRGFHKWFCKNKSESVYDKRNWSPLGMYSWLRSLAKILSLSGSLLQILVDALSYKVKATPSTLSEPAERKACHESALKQSVECAVRLRNISATNTKKLHNKGKNKKDCTAPVLRERNLIFKTCMQIYTYFRGRTLHKLWYAWPSTTHEASKFVSFFFVFFHFFFLPLIPFHHYEYTFWLCRLVCFIKYRYMRVRWTAVLSFMLSKRQSRHLETGW